jgi:hypothetical protein
LALLNGSVASIQVWPQNTRIMRHGSKMIARTLERAANTASLAFRMAPAIGAYWEKDLRPELDEGRPSPDVAGLLKAYARKIQHLGERLSAANYGRHQVRVREMSQGDRVREAANKLRDLLVDVRYTLDRSFGKKVGVANFEGRHDLQRIPLTKLPRIAGALLGVLSNEAYGWQDRDPDWRVPALRTRLAAAIEELQLAQSGKRQAKSKRLQAAGEASRDSAADEKALYRAINVVRRLLECAGFELESKTLRHKRRRRPRVRRRAQ